MYEEQELARMKERSDEEANVGWGGDDPVIYEFPDVLEAIRFASPMN